MTSGISLFLIAVGAILYFAVNATVSGLEIDTVGLILMIVGAVGFILGLYLTFVRGRPDPTLGDPVAPRRRPPEY